MIFVIFVFFVANPAFAVLSSAIMRSASKSPIKNQPGLVSHINHKDHKEDLTRGRAWGTSSTWLQTRCTPGSIGQIRLFSCMKSHDRPTTKTAEQRRSNARAMTKPVTTNCPVDNNTISKGRHRTHCGWPNIAPTGGPRMRNCYNTP